MHIPLTSLTKWKLMNSLSSTVFIADLTPEKFCIPTIWREI